MLIRYMQNELDAHQNSEGMEEGEAGMFEVSAYSYKLTKGNTKMPVTQLIWEILSEHME